ncbi:MAG: translocation/assembly module TamB domain-containing protein, partial [Planctomycetota bacterium]
QTDFNLNLAVAQADKTSEVKVASRITMKKQTGWSLKGTSGNLTVDVDDLDIESLGPIFALAGLDVQAKGLVNGRMKSEIEDGRFENLSANVEAGNLDITGAELKGDRLRTSDLDVNVKLSQGKETITIDDLQLKSDWASVSAGGIVPTTFKSLDDFLQADSNYSLKGTFNCDVAAVLSQMPKTLGLKEGTQITSGQLDGIVETSTKVGQKQIQAKANLTGLEGAVEGKKIALSEPIRAEAQISSDKAGINFDKLDISAPFAKINCAGSIESMKYNAETDLAKLQSELGQFINIGQYQMAGELLEQGQISIKENIITASGSATLKNLRLSSPEGVSVSEPMAEVSFACDIDRKNNLLSVDSIQAGTSFGRVNINDGVVPLNKNSAKPLSLAISANNVDLKKLQPFAVLFASFPEEMQLAGIAESTISVSSEENTYRITTDSTKIKNLKLTYPDRKPFEPNEVSLAFDAEINPEQKAINVKKLQLESPQIKIHKGEFSQLSKVGKTKLEGQAECEYDWSAVSTAAAPFLPEDLTLQGTRKDTVSFISEYPAGQTDKLIPNLSAKAKLGFEQAGYMGLNFGPTDVDIQIQSGLLMIAPFTTIVNEGQFNFASQADFKQKPALLKTSKPMEIVKNIKVNDETTRKLLKYLSPIFADAVNVSGIANFNCEQLAIPLSSTDKNHAVIIGTISMSQLRLQASNLLGQILSIAGGGDRGAEITIHPTRFVLQKGFLRYDDMQMDIGDNPVNFRGVIGLDKSLDMTITLPYTTEGRTVRIDRETRGRRITLPLKGTVDEPKLDMGKLLEEQLKGQIEDQLLKGLEELLK